MFPEPIDLLMFYVQRRRLVDRLARRHALRRHQTSNHDGAYYRRPFFGMSFAVYLFRQTHVLESLKRHLRHCMNLMGTFITKERRTHQTL
jgi:hypothetical protein